MAKATNGSNGVGATRHPPTLPVHDQLLARVVDEFFQRKARGEDVDVEALAQEYPDVGRELLDYLHGAALIERVLPEFRHGESPIGAGERLFERLPSQIDGYEIMEEIGRGGMGVVYRARERSTRREVALKVMLAGPFASAHTRARFEREMQLAARLEHPQIVSVLAGGSYGGRCYYVMEYVRGQPLGQFADSHRTNLKELLALFARICEATNFAHQRGVIHRDLKPGNILVDENGSPHILDFGLAKSVEPEPDGGGFQTRPIAGHILGTLPYIAPELAAGSVRDVDIRSDVYAIGVMLFEALTGKHPYPEQGSTLDALQTIASAEPPPPSSLRADLDDEIDAIVLKALEKSKDQRYQTARALGDDIDRYLRGDSIEAKRHSRAYVLRKTLRRYRSQALAALLIFVAVAVFAATTTLLWRQAERQRLTAESLSGELADTADRLAQELHLGNLQRGRTMLVADQWYSAEKVLWREFLRQPDAPAYWSLWTYYLENPVYMARSGTGWVRDCAYSPDGSLLAAGTREGYVSLYNAHQREAIWVTPTTEGPIVLTAFTDDGEKVLAVNQKGCVHVWTTPDRRPLSTQRLVDSQITAAALFPDSSHIVTAAEEGLILVWSLQSLLSRADEDGTEPVSAAPQTSFAFPGQVDALAVSEDGKWLAAGGEEADVWVWPLDSGTGPARSCALERGVLSLAFSQDGRFLACGGFSDVSLWDPVSNSRIWNTSLHSRWVTALMFARSGDFLITGGWDGTVHVLRTSDGEPVRTSHGFGTAVYTLAMSPNERDMTVGAIGEIRALRPLEREALLLEREMDRAEPRAIALSDTRGEIAYSAGESGSLELASLAEGEVRMVSSGHQAQVDCLAVSPAGSKLAAGDAAGMISVRSLDSPDRVKVVPGSQGRIRAVAFSPEGSFIATGGSEGEVILRDAETLAEIDRLPAHNAAVRCLAFSPDGTLLASGGSDFKLVVHDLRSKTIVFDASAMEWINAVAFTADGKHIISTGADLYLRIHDSMGKLVWSKARPHEHWVNCVAVMPPGDVLVTGGHDRSVKFWRLPDLLELTSIHSAWGSVYTLAMSRDGRYLAIGAEKGVTVLDCSVPGRLMRDNIEFAIGRYRPLDRRGLPVDPSTIQPQQLQSVLRRWPDAVAAHDQR